MVKKVQTWFFKVQNYSETSDCLFLHEKKTCQNIPTVLKYSRKSTPHLPFYHIFPPEFEISQFLGQIKSPRRSRGDFLVFYQWNYTTFLHTIWGDKINQCYFFSSWQFDETKKWPNLSHSGTSRTHENWKWFSGPLPKFKVAWCVVGERQSSDSCPMFEIIITMLKFGVN